MTTVPPAKTTAAPDEDIASARAVLLSRPAVAVLPVAGDDEQGVVDADSQPDDSRDRDRRRRDVHDAGEHEDAADARADRHEGETDRHQGGHDGPEGHQQHEQRDQDADALQRRRLVGSVEEDGVTTELDPEVSGVRRVDQLGQGHEGSLAQLGRRLVEGERGVADPAVVRDGAGREGVCDVHDMVGPGHVGQDRVDGLLLTLQRLAVVDREDDEGCGLGRLGELVLEQLHGAFALAALGAEGVDEGAAAAPGEGEHGAEDDDPARDGAPGCLALAMAMLRVNLFMVVPFADRVDA